MRTTSGPRVHVISTRAAFLLCAAIVLSACATRSPTAIAPTAPVAAGIIWRIEEGDIIKTKVYTSPDLSTEAMVTGNGTAFFPAVGRIAVAGLTLDSVETLLNARYSTQVVRNAAVQVTMQRDVTLHGQVRNPGIYPSDPNTTILGLIARAGGLANASASSAPEIYLELSDGRRLLLPREARLGSVDMHRRDAIFLNETSFFSRNATALQATSLAMSILSALVSLVAATTR
jgi:protein involved in polysaccharide export with SLBB domain